MTFVAMVVASAAWTVPARAGGGDTWTFPGTCPGTTLQDCIDGAAGGDTIEIATDDPVNEAVTIDHSLTIRPASGFHPTVLLMAVGDGSSGTLGVFLQDLSVPRGVVVLLSAGAGHIVALRHLTVDPGRSSEPGVLFDLRVPSTVDLTNSTIRAKGNDADQVAVSTSNPSGLVTFRAVGNRLFGDGTPNGGGGFSLETSKPGSILAQFDNNSVWNVRSCCGAQAGLSVHPRGSGHVDVDAVGNTFDHGGFIGLEVRNDLLATGHVSVDVFDDVFSNNRGAAIDIESIHKPTVEFREGHSDFFANGSLTVLEGHALGSGNLAVNPRFAKPGAGGLALTASSPLIDRGVVCSPGGVASPDAARHARLAGRSVDMGAFERGAVPPTGLVVVGDGSADFLDGTSGADILCGMRGNDTIHGEGGRDYLDGGLGGDVLFGDPGPDRLLGGPGDDPCLDSFDGVGGNDRIDGGPGDDRFLADQGDLVVSAEHRTNCN
jgi:hypothetical protein